MTAGRRSSTTTEGLERGTVKTSILALPRESGPPGGAMLLEELCVYRGFFLYAILAIYSPKLGLAQVMLNVEVRL